MPFLPLTYRECQETLYLETFDRLIERMKGPSFLSIFIKQRNRNVPCLLGLLVTYQKTIITANNCLKFDVYFRKLFLNTILGYLRIKK